MHDCTIDDILCYVQPGGELLSRCCMVHRFAFGRETCVCVCVCVCVCQVVNEGCFIGERLLHTSCDDLDCRCLRSLSCLF